MNLDIYTLRPINEYSKEHIIHNFLGGIKEYGDLIDKETNDILGSTIDYKLSNALNPFRVLLDARSNRGNQEPQPIRKLQCIDGNQYDLLSGGKPQISRPFVEMIDEDGTIRIKGVARSFPEMKNLLKRVSREKGFSLEDVINSSTVHKDNIPSITIPMELGGPDFDRAIAKIACNFLAANNKEQFLNKKFDEIRDYVYKGNNSEAKRYVYYIPYHVSISTKSRLGDLDHLVLVRSDPDSDNVVALVCLYGNLNYLVLLGENSKLTTPLSYRVDQFGKSDRINHEHDLDIGIPNSKKVISANNKRILQCMKKQVSYIVGKGIKKQEDEWTNVMLHECISEVFGEPNGSPITKEQISRISIIISERYVEWLVRRGCLSE